ncbi:sugar phosphate isomerase/epimerase [Bacilli bacterium PM5-3]|nr:sugar phosphate isomerase/epimerase [Bacilli bacterium PM5-3]MDH6603106.1 sugar phosphate isomerase/epimerase [Bacilli bacterium PM5-9]
MNLNISQLIEEDEYTKIIDKYNVGLELIDFSIADVLDNPSEHIKKYQAPLYDKVSFGIHGPFFDLIPATFDSLIKEVTLKRFNQVYKIAQGLNAEYIVFHTGYLKDVYFYESWLHNSIIFWNEFLKDKDNSIQIYIENVFEDEYQYLKDLVTTINNPIFNICLDLGHANIRSKSSLNEWIVELKDYIKHFHIHNNDGIDDKHQSILNGEIGYEKVFDLIKELDIDASISLEMSNQKDIIESINFLNNH